MNFTLDLFRAFLGIFILLGVCYALSRNRKAINWRLVGIGVSLQFIIAFLMLEARGVREGVRWVAQGFSKTLEFTSEGAEFLFGSIVQNVDSFGFIFAFQVLPTIVFFSALTALLYYLGVLQKVVYGLAWLLSKTMGLSGPESLAAAANIFIGQTEAPLVIKPYLEKMTRSELLCLMVGGMATIAGSVYVAYIGMLGGGDKEAQDFFARHLLTASMISAPAAIVCAKMLFPEDKAELAKVTGAKDDDDDNDPAILKQPVSDSRLTMAADDSTNLLDAISKGTTDGLKLAVNVGAMLLVFTAMIYMVNTIFLSSTDLLNELVRWFNPAIGNWNEQIAAATAGRFEGFSFSYLLALLFAPVAWVIGVPMQDITTVGQLLGLKTVLNEFVAYEKFQALRSAGIEMSPKSTLIAAYALCGFANFASIGIQIGGISAIAPGQRENLTRLGLLSLVGGTIACLMTGAVAGVFYQQ